MQENIRLLLLYLAICLVIIVRVAVEENGFTTPDSIHYIAAAGGLLENGQLDYKTFGQTLFFSPWPMGYPLSIALVSKVTTLSTFWSSKGVNLLWIALAFALFKKISARHAAWVGLVFCASSLLDIFSFTWSEGGLLVVMLWFSIALHHFLKAENQQAEWGFQLFFSVILGFLYRYFGGFLLGLLSGFGVYYLLKKKWKEVVILLLLAVGVLVFINSYFWHLQTNTGYYSGITRVPTDEPFLYLLLNLSQAQINEFVLIRKLTFHSIDVVAIFLLFVQLFLMGIAFYRLRQVDQWKSLLRHTPADSMALTVAFVGGAYWVVMVGLRFFLKFDLFDFRLLAPASFLLLTAAHLYFAAENRASLLIKIKFPVTCIYLLALAHGLYKKNLLLMLWG